MHVGREERIRALDDRSTGKVSEPALDAVDQAPCSGRRPIRSNQVTRQNAALVEEGAAAAAEGEGAAAAPGGQCLPVGGL